MELSYLAAITTGITVTSAARVAICLYALKGVPARDRPAVIRALACLLGGEKRLRQRHIPRAREPDAEPARDNACGMGRVVRLSELSDREGKAH